jgi:hypothetical protein
MKTFFFFFLLCVSICTPQMVEAQVAQDDLVMTLTSDSGDDMNSIEECAPMNRIITDFREFFSPFFTQKYWVEYLGYNRSAKGRANVAPQVGRSH